ncbi:MAG: amidohydrolase [Bacteroidetes bacterium]|nr:amidohydrolase [Bacteroidota bacterium]
MSRLFLLLLLPAVLFPQQYADIIYTNGKFWTVDPARPEAEAVAVIGGRIAAVGSSREIAAWKGKRTSVIDLKKRRVLPGFIDNHTHFMTGGFQLQSVDLRTAGDEAAFARIIGERARQRPGRWITGGDWDHDLWKSGRLPTKEMIDSLTGATPVLVNRYDGHMALANSAALALAGITRTTPDPAGGTIVRDPVTGEPTGLLKDEAMSPVYAVIPPPSDEEMLGAARLALAEARKFGITSIQDMAYSNGDRDIKTYRELERRGELTARINCVGFISNWRSLSAAGIQVPFGTEKIGLGALKAFVDGSLGSSTALFFEKFLNEDTYGLPMDVVTDGRLERWMTAADSARLQLRVHAIGDSANSLLLDMFGRIVRRNPQWDRRFRIEHAQHIHPKDFSRFASLGVIAAVQPYHAIDDGRWAVNRIGDVRCRTTYPFRSFLDAGVKLSFGSDWTVAPLDPLLGIYAAVTRRTIDGANPGGWYPEQRITVKEAIEAYTITNAYAAFEEKEKGSITPGKLADMVVLSDDILIIDPVRIADTRAVMTILGGTVIHRSE